MDPSKLIFLNKFIQENILPDFRVINKSETRDNKRTKKENNK